MNRYAYWKYILILFIIVIGALFAIPNLFGNDPALQISSARGSEQGGLTELAVEIALEEAGIIPKSIDVNQDNVIVRFNNTDAQLQAQAAVKKSLGKEYVVALNLAPATPGWLRSLGAEPMFLGLDLRGGVHFLMEVDMAAAVKKAEERYVSDFKTQLRENKIRYKTISRSDNGGILIRYKNLAQQTEADSLLKKENFDIDIESISTSNGDIQSLATLKEDSLKQTRENALQQNITTLRKRVNELGVAEPIIQRQGVERIVVQLPGVQDTAQAKNILGATATLEFRMVDTEHSAAEASKGGRIPVGTKLYQTREGFPVLLKKHVMLTGDYIIDASAGFDPVDGASEVNIVLDGRGARIFSKATADNIGKPLSVVFMERKTQYIALEDGTKEKIEENTEEVISIATIQDQLGKRFRITGLDSADEAHTLALLLRAGALAAPINIIEERTVGPSLGQDNINKGFYSVMIGFSLVLVFMVVYYKRFGLYANIALALNLVFIVALLSMLQATLTLPGIAGIVLTVGMAVDANVLIFERIREEIRNGNSPQASIHAGYEKAFSTIADANITTLIAAVLLFSFGTGPIKGFAVTLSLGILSSMFTAIMVTRALVNMTYGGKRINTLSI